MHEVRRQPEQRGPVGGQAVPSVQRLILTRFRTWEALRLEIPPGPVVLTGGNGAGKTNLLEALSFLAPGRGLRRARLTEITTTGAEDRDWAVATILATAEGPLALGTGSEGAANGRERRVVHVDGRAVRSQTALAEHVAVAWLTPVMDRLFTDGAASRRRYLDRLVFGFDPEHAGRLSRYEHALRERARLLARGVRDETWLSSLEETLAETGIATARARRDTASRLAAACQDGASPFPRAALSVTGPVEDILGQKTDAEIAEECRARFKANRRRDAEAGITTFGPHRSDLTVSYLPDSGLPNSGPSDSGGAPVPAAACSTGEQKALLLSLTLANARLLSAGPLGPPLLLLDEAAAHLDPSRREALFAELLALGGQAWLTGTEAFLFSLLRGKARFLTVRKGEVEEE